MPTFRYAKLVRDNIPQWHAQSGHHVKGRRLTGRELINGLCDKLHEEADEVGAAMSREEMIEEIADVQQILADLCAEMKVSATEVEDARRVKLAKKGGFKTGEYIETVTMPNEDDKWVSYCRNNPAKYPEIISK
ncbi:MAG: nucleoside triphosphate pyrophosphohydrolase [Candidatus Saccharimonadales bacterium]